MKVDIENINDYKIITLTEYFNNTNILVEFKYYNTNEYTLSKFNVYTDSLDEIKNYNKLLNDEINRIIESDIIDHNSLYLVGMMEYQIRQAIYNTENKDKNLYFLLNSNGLVKIGLSKDVDNRVKQLQNILKDDISIIKVLNNKAYLENKLHIKFSNDNIYYKGQTEWFYPSFELNKFISMVDENNIDELI